MRHTYLIARREYLSYVATPGFWISLAMVPLFMLLGIAVPLLLEGSTPTRYFSILDADGRYDTAVEQRLDRQHKTQIRSVLLALSKVPGQSPGLEKALTALEAGQSVEAVLDVLDVNARTAVLAIKQDYVLVPAPGVDAAQLRPFLLGQLTIETDQGPQPLYAAATITRTGNGAVSIKYWSTAITAEQLKRTIVRAVRDQMRIEAFADAGVETEIVRSINAMEPDLVSLSPEKSADQAEVTQSDTAPYFIAVVFAFVLWSVVFSVANMLLTSTIEEKSGKVLDSLLVAAPVRALLAGKLLGVAAVSFTLLSSWALAGGVAATLGGQFMPAGEGASAAILGAVIDPWLILPFLGYFVFGYLMFGTMFLALGSLCETLQEAQSLMSPIIFILMVPMMALMFVVKDPTSPILAVLSWIPLFTPYLMLARLPTDPPLYELFGTTLVMIITTMLILWAAGRVFHAGAMHQAGVDYFKKLLRLKR